MNYGIITVAILALYLFGLWGWYWHCFWFWHQWDRTKRYSDMCVRCGTMKFKKAKLFVDDAGQTIAEFAVILPIFVFVGFVMADIVWLTRTAAAIEYVVNEAARCEAIGSLACAAPNSPQSYATNLAQNLRLNSASTQLSTPPCSPQSCSVSIAYQYKPLGAWFPALTISRTGTASVAPGQEQQP
jgi:Flp pilus assembly protein TadG